MSVRFSVRRAALVAGVGAATLVSASAASAATYTFTVPLRCDPAGARTIDGTFRIENHTVTFTLPDVVRRDGDVTISNVSQTLDIPGGVLGGEGFDHAEVTSSVIRSGTSFFDFGAAAGPQAIPQSGPVRLPASGSYPTLSHPTAVAAYEQLNPSFSTLSILVHRNAPGEDERFDCEILVASEPLNLPVVPLSSSPAITGVGTAWAGLGGIVEIRGRNLQKVDYVLVGGQRTIFWALSSSRLYILPKAYPVGTRDLWLHAPNRDVVGAQLVYKRLW